MSVSLSSENNMKSITIHQFPFPSSSSSSSSPAPHPAEPAMQLKGVRKLVRRFRHGIRHLSHFGPNSNSDITAAVPVPAFDSLVGALHAVPVTLPLSPKSKPSFDSMSSSALSDTTSAPSTYATALSQGDEHSLSTAHVAASASVSTSDTRSSLTLDSETGMSSLPVESPPPGVSQSDSELAHEQASAPVAVADSVSSKGDLAAAEEDIRFESSEALAPEPHSEATESEVPDPFLVDEDEPPSEPAEASEEDEAPEAHVGLSVDEAQQSLAEADEVPLAQALSEEADSPSPSPPPSDPFRSPLPDIGRPTPPAQAQSDEEDEEETPELYLPGLTLPTMFLPIPNTDPLTSLLIKFIPPENRPARDVSGGWQGSDFNTLVMTNSWRALAKMARDRLVDADPEDIDLILSLWYLRLSCLARLRLFNQTSAECTNLYAVLNSVEPPETRAWVFDKKLPFELEVLHARLAYWAGDHMGYVDALAGLLRRCKATARAAGARRDESGCALWKERGARVCLILASQFVEMRDFTAATDLLEPLCGQGGSDRAAPSVEAAVGRIYLHAGYVSMAAKHFASVARDPAAEPALKSTNSALLAAAEGDWPKAAEGFRAMLAADPESFVATNNLAVALLSQGRIREGIRLLEEAINISPSATLQAEPLLFNLSTMYELRSTAGVEKKRNLLIEVAKWAGDGLRTTCLKMPVN